MVELNIENVEKLIFYNKEIRKDLGFSDLFKKWEFSLRNNFSSIRKKVVLDFLTQLSEEDKTTIEKHLGYPVKIVKLPITPTNIKIHIDDLQNWLNNNSISDNFTIYRNKDNIFISSV